jgi:hypothetical protein
LVESQVDFDVSQVHMVVDDQAVANTVTAQLMLQVILLVFQTKFACLQVQVLGVVGRIVDANAIFEQLTWHHRFEVLQ